MERREGIDDKKRRIAEDPKGCLGEAFLEVSEIESSRVSSEMLEWAIAFAEYFDEHPEEWREVEQADPPRFEDYKKKIDNFLDLFRKVLPI